MPHVHPEIDDGIVDETVLSDGRERPSAHRLVWRTVGHWYQAVWMATGIAWQRWLEPVVVDVAQGLLDGSDPGHVLERFGAVRAARGIAASAALRDLDALLDHLGHPAGAAREPLYTAVTRGWLRGHASPRDLYADPEWLARRVAAAAPSRRGRAAPAVAVVVDVDVDPSDGAGAVRAMSVAAALLSGWFPSIRPARAGAERFAGVVHAHPGLARTSAALRDALAHAPDLAGVDVAMWLEPLPPDLSHGDVEAAAVFVEGLETRAPARAPSDEDALSVLSLDANARRLDAPDARGERNGVAAVTAAAVALLLAGGALGTGWRPPASRLDVATHAGPGTLAAPPSPMEGPSPSLGGELWPVAAPAGGSGVAVAPSSAAPEPGTVVPGQAPSDGEEVSVRAPEISRRAVTTAPPSEAADAQPPQAPAPEPPRSPDPDDGAPGPESPGPSHERRPDHAADRGGRSNDGAATEADDSPDAQGERSPGRSASPPGRRS